MLVFVTLSLLIISPLTCTSFYIIYTDESPSYICVNPLLLDAAEKLPTTQKALSILCSPLPASMRLDPSPTSTTTTTSLGGGTAGGTGDGGKDKPVPVPPVDILEAIKIAVEKWEIEVEEGEIVAGELIKEGDDMIVTKSITTNHTTTNNNTNTSDNNNGNSNGNGNSNVVNYIEE